MPLFAYKNDWSQAGNNFHFLRLTLASVVVISHGYPLFAGTVEPWLAYGFPFSTGQACVMAFFVISGILVTRSATLSRSALSYTVSRVMRLVPGAFVCALWMAFVVGVSFTTLSLWDYLSDGSVWSFVRRNTLLISVQYPLPGVFKNNVYPAAVNGSLWSLRIEIRMYIILGLIIFLMKMSPSLFKYLKYILLILAIVAYFMAILPVFLPEGVMEQKANWVYGYYFSVGAVIYCWDGKIPRNLALAVMLFLVSLLTVDTKFLDPAFRIAMPYLVYCFSFSQFRPLTALRNWPDISYGVYIYAFPVQQSLSALFSYKFGMWYLTAVSLAVACGFAILSWKLIEAPSLARKHRVEAAIIFLFRRLWGLAPESIRHRRHSQRESGSL